MQAIDVVVLTKNSEHLLDKCLASIYETVPVNKLIIVDGFSTDSTLKIVEDFNRRYGNVVIIKVNGSRARAREKGILQVSTEWFFFSDTDIILSKDWYQKAQKSMQPDVGAIWGINIDVIPSLKHKSILRMQTLIAHECFRLRGGTHDTLLRRDIVKDIKIPERLHTYEDSFIINWIKNKGYKVVVGKDICCLHYKPPTNWNFSNAADGALLELKCGLVYSKNFRYAIYYPFFMFYWFLQIGIQNMKQLFST
jgi:glycosyltransferase involved in cell wall biosynthesis